MIRSSIGISTLPVSEEIDPGFGPDTEQRRVEFAAKLEEETFSIALGDATKLARVNLKIALRIWKKDDLVKLVNDLELRDIMLIWLIFEVAYISQIWGNLLDGLANATLCSTKDYLKKFLQSILVPLSKDIPSKIERVRLPVREIVKVREAYGGDLIYSLKLRNENEIIKIYQMTYSKLPKSLRDRFYEMITGVKIEYQKLVTALKSEKVQLLENFVALILERVAKIEEYVHAKEKLDIIRKIIAAFDQDAASCFLKGFTDVPERSEEVEEKVKRYYGIIED